MRRNYLLILIVVTSLAACNKKTQTDSDSVESTEAVVESGVSVLSGSLDDQTSNTSFAVNRSENTTNIWATLLVNKAHASSCSRAFLQSCQSGVKTVDYSGCSTLGGRVNMSGSVTLTYSNTSCLLSTAGDYVVRTYDFSVSGPRGGSIATTSDVKEDYRLGSANTYGGGAKLTKTSAGYNLEILGKHSSLAKNGVDLYNVSVRTLQPLQVTGGFERSLRHVSNGQLEINHNIAKFTTVMSASNLQWSASCCHPTSGTLSVTRSGSIQGTATVTFTDECGVASLEENGQVRKIELSYCE